MPSDAEAFRQSLIRRLELIERLQGDPELQALALTRSAKDACWWFNNFCWTYDPRGASVGLPAYLPFDLFPRQEELIGWLDDWVAMTCYCCARTNREVCLCEGPTCRTCLRCESHCLCIQKPKGLACAKPKPPIGAQKETGR